MADTLSRAPLNILTTDETAKETENFVQAEISSIPASKDYLESYRKAQSEDAVCSKLMEFCRSGWPKTNICKVTSKSTGSFTLTLVYVIISYFLDLE